MDLFETGYQEIDADRDPDLGLDSVFGGAEKTLIRRFCLIYLKNSSMCQRLLYSAAMVKAVSTIHEIGASRLWNDLIKDVDVMNAPLGDADEHWNRAAQVDHRVHFDGGFGSPKIRPRKQRQAQIDGRGVQCVNHLVDLQFAVIRTVEPARFADEHLGQRREGAPIPKLVGVGQIGPRYLSPDAHRIKMTRTSQAGLDIAQTLAAGTVLNVHRQDGTSETIELGSDQGYAREIDYFLQCLRDGKRPEIVTLEDGRDSLRIYEAEQQSLELGCEVALSAAAAEALKA